MIKMLGESRVLDSAVSETGESSARKINLFGVKSLSELQDKPLLVKSNFDGVTNTTIQINELEAKQVKVFKNNSVVDLYNRWIASGQLYMLMYNGVVFIAFPLGVSSSEGGGGSTGMDILSIPIQVTNLQDGDNESTILSAFGNEDVELALQDYIEQDLGIIAFGDTTLSGYKLYLLETYTTNDTPKSDVLRFIKCINDNYIIVTLKLNRKNSEELPLYESVEVSEFNISEVIDTISGEGENIALNDTADAKFKRFKISGNSKQETRSGKNILKNNLTTQTINGVTATVNEDKSVTLNGTATAKTSFYLIQNGTDILKANINYTLSKSNASISNIILQLCLSAEGLSNIYKSAGTTNNTFSLTEDRNINYCAIIIESGTTINNITVYPQLERDTTATPYEQYGAMPSTEFKSDIQNITGNANFHVVHELADISKFTTNGYVNGEGTISSPTGRGEKATKLVKVKPNTNYIFFIINTNSKFDNWIGIGEYEEESSSSFIKRNTSTDSFKYNFTTSEKTNYVILSARNLEEATNVSFYETSKIQNFTFPLAEGQRLMKNDYLADDGIHHKRKQIILDGTETWHYNSINTAFYIHFSDAKKAQNNNEIVIASNYFKGETANNCIKSTYDYCIGTNTNAYTWLRYNKFTTEEQLKTWLAEQYANGTPVTVEYELAEEVIEPYTEEQQAVYDEIKKTAHSYGEQTHIFSTDEISPIFDVEAYKKSNNIDNVISLIAKYADSAVYLYAPKISNITVLSSEWVINSETNKYEYTKSDSSITNKHLIEIFMDLENQAKIADGYVESYDGGYKIITSTKPTEDINMTLKIQLTV